MSGDTFRFKRFEISHGRSSMRVGTDGVLLGAWGGQGLASDGVENMRILDVGCGCGLIALMAAQRFPGAWVYGIDVDASSVSEAGENALLSPFSGRVQFMHSDVRDFVSVDGVGVFNLILCNPPYYTEDTLPPNERRSRARNSSCLPFSVLLSRVKSLLAPGGVFSVIIPMQARDEFLAQALLNCLYLHRECRVQTTPSKAPKRVMLEFTHQDTDQSEFSTLVLQDSSATRSEQYALLCRDFYL